VNEIMKNQLAQFNDEGYVVFNLNDSKSLIDEINSDIQQLIENGEYKTNSKIYSYNNSPRIVESWRYSKAAKKLAFNEQILAFLSEFYQSVPQPFSTINFLRSTEQPLHSDYIHFGTIPHFRLAAAWVALEDINPASGPIQLVPGSHKMPAVCFSDLGLPAARSLGDVKRNYTMYEDYVRDELIRLNIEPISPPLVLGDVIIWSANLLHGSPDCVDNRLSRRSQVTHYHFSETEMFYNPSFSRIHEQKFVARNVELIPE
jgi:ectoine hydroxylase-related dioxygenase (phytanoyl-CoA dioxygenase family)